MVLARFPGERNFKGTIAMANACFKFKASILVCLQFLRRNGSEAGYIIDGHGAPREPKTNRFLFLLQTRSSSGAKTYVE